VQFNDGGSFGGDAGLTYNKTTDTLTAGTFSGSGASLTTLNASNLSSGTVASARLPNPQTSAIGGVMRNTGSVGQFVSGIASNGELQYGSPAGGLANITETLNTGSPNITVNAEQLAVTGGTTNVNLVLTPRGTGGFMLGGPPDGTATGGNIIGVRAVDLQLAHGAAANVASGTDSFAAGTGNRASGSNSVAIGGTNIASSASDIALGSGNTASGGNSVAIGRSSTASNSDAFALGRSVTASGQSSFASGFGVTAAGYASVAFGYYSTARINGLFAYAGSYALGGSIGTEQWEVFPLVATTTNATPTNMLGGHTGGVRYSIPSSRISFVDIMITAVSSANSATFRRHVAIRNTAGTTSLVGAVQTIGTDQATGGVGWSISVTADDTNDALQVQVTGEAATTIKWMARLEGVFTQTP
jgi:hypothetical protein